ncbi:hypothetical protein ABW19_dt0208637 [Dactylella cylindrospora]|nr:hypothetical protein ABW19_dt0208637 [Dactylella cylindrospora]
MASTTPPFTLRGALYRVACLIWLTTLSLPAFAMPPIPPIAVPFSLLRPQKEESTVPMVMPPTWATDSARNIEYDRRGSSDDQSIAISTTTEPPTASTSEVRVV